MRKREVHAFESGEFTPILRDSLSETARDKTYYSITRT